MKVKEHEEQEGMDINEKENEMYVIDYVCPKYVPADTHLDHVFNCFKCSPYHSKICFSLCKYCSYGSR